MNTPQTRVEHVEAALQWARATNGTLIEMAKTHRQLSEDAEAMASLYKQQLGALETLLRAMKENPDD